MFYMYIGAIVSKSVSMVYTLHDLTDADFCSPALRNNCGGMTMVGQRNSHAQNH